MFRFIETIFWLAIFALVFMAMHGCSLGSLDFSDKRDIIITQEKIEWKGDLQPWDFKHILELYDRMQDGNTSKPKS